MMTKMKKIMYSILTTILLIVLMGCTAVDTISEIKKEPDVIDASINLQKKSVKVVVVLNKNADIMDTANLEERCSLIVQKNYNNKDVHISVIKERN